MKKLTKKRVRSVQLFRKPRKKKYYEYCEALLTFLGNDIYISLDPQGLYIHAGEEFQWSMPWFRNRGNY